MVKTNVATKNKTSHFEWAGLAAMVMVHAPPSLSREGGSTRCHVFLQPRPAGKAGSVARHALAISCASLPWSGGSGSFPAYLASVLCVALSFVLVPLRDSAISRTPWEHACAPCELWSSSQTKPNPTARPTPALLLGVITLIIAPPEGILSGVGRPRTPARGVYRGGGYSKSL